MLERSAACAASRGPARPDCIINPAAMSDDAKQAAAQRRAEERERRQQRIRDAGATRMAKITGAAGSRDYKERVEPVREPADTTDDLTVAGDAAGAVDPPVPSLDDLRALLQAQSPVGEGANPDFQTLLDMMGDAQATAPGAPGAAAAARPKHRAIDSHYFELLHLLISAYLGVYAALTSVRSLVPLFTALQIGLVALQATVGQWGFAFTDLPFIGLFLGMLPPHRRNQLRYVGVAFSIGRHVYRDLAVLVFAYGLASRGGSDYARVH